MEVDFGVAGLEAVGAGGRRCGGIAGGVVLGRVTGFGAHGLGGPLRLETLRRGIALYNTFQSPLTSDGDVVIRLLALAATGF